MAITTINSTDSGATSRTTINDNFTDLDTTKADLASPTFTGTLTVPAVKITTGAGANKVLTSDADGDGAWTTPGGVTSTAGVSAGPASSSTQTITHGLGRTPIIIRLDGVGRQMAGTGSPHSHGVYNSSGNNCVYMPGTGESVTPLSSASFAVHLKGDTGVVATGVVGNVGGTSFDIVWTAGGDLSTYGVFLWEAQ